jgi:hypothetical protein
LISGNCKERGTEMTYRWIIALLTTGSLVTGSAFARSRKINRWEAPPAVEKILQSETQGATVKRLSEEDQNGRTYYKAELAVDGHEKTLFINAAGDVENVREQVALNSLPADVRAGLKARAGFLGRIAKVESITKNGELVAYEARVERPRYSYPSTVVITNSRVQVGADGKRLDHKE